MTQSKHSQDITKDIQKAWVVFSGQTDLPWLKILKPGFRHCYVLLNDGEQWITVDPLSNYMDIAVHHVPQDFDLPRWMQSRGHLILPADIERKDKQAPWMVFTCVEAVKRVIGLHSWTIITPWQLYRHLNAKFQKKIETYTPENTTDYKGEFSWEV